MSGDSTGSKGSCSPHVKTLAARHDSTVTKMARKHMTTIATPHGPRRCFEAKKEREGRKPLVARFGGIPLKRQRKAVITDYPTDPIVPRRPGSQLLARLGRQQCEACGQPGQAEVHQVRRLADLAAGEGRQQPEWAKLMTRMQRKTLIVCPPCHQLIHTGKPAAKITQTTTWKAGRIERCISGLGRGPLEKDLRAPRQWPTGTYGQWGDGATSDPWPSICRRAVSSDFDCWHWKTAS